MYFSVGGIILNIFLFPICVIDFLKVVRLIYHRVTCVIVSFLPFVMDNRRIVDEKTILSILDESDDENEVYLPSDNESELDISDEDMYDNDYVISENDSVSSESDSEADSEPPAKRKFSKVNLASQRKIDITQPCLPSTSRQAEPAEVAQVSRTPRVSRCMKNTPTATNPPFVEPSWGKSNKMDGSVPLIPYDHEFAPHLSEIENPTPLKFFFRNVAKRNYGKNCVPN